ncbi:hypothetical protein GCM10025792_10500 [Pseudonocardia tropica]
MCGPVVGRGGGPGAPPALTPTSVFDSAAGLLGSLVAARAMPQESVGRATEFVSAMQLIGGAAPLDLGVGIVRRPPGAGRKSVRLVSAAFC